MDEDLIAFTPSKERDPDGSKLRGTLNAHLELEKAQAIRQLVAHLLGLLSAPVWLVAVWPGWIPAGVRSVALTTWAVCSAGLLMSIGSEWKWRKERDRYLAELRPPPSATRSD